MIAVPDTPPNARTPVTVNVCNIARAQLDAPDDHVGVIEDNRSFFDEYFRAFDTRESFCRGLPRALDRAAKDHRTGENVASIVAASRRAAQRLEPLAHKILDGESGSITVLPMVGRGMWDGHGLVGHDEPAFFVDMTLLNEHLATDGFQLDTHMLHEMIHAVHYVASPTFFPDRTKSVRHLIADQFAAEGLATAATVYLTGCSRQEALWFGFLNDADYTDWQAHAATMRVDMGQRVSNLDNSPPARDGGRLNGELFRAPETLEKGRVGYLYGHEIVTAASRDHDFTSLFRLDRSDWQHRLRDYFEV